MRGGFKNPWWVVAGAVTGLIVCNGPVLAFTFGVFLKSITEDLGLSRGAFSPALTVHAAITAIVLPVIGWLVRPSCADVKVKPLADPGETLNRKCSDSVNAWDPACPSGDHSNKRSARSHSRDGRWCGRRSSNGGR